MTIAIAPKSLARITAPAVGIFWLVSGILVIERSMLDEAEPYGDCLTHATGHYDRWLQWQALGAEWLRSLGFPISILMSEYDEWPRGRIVYEILTERFILYADGRLQKPGIIAAVRAAFGLGGVEVIVRGDSHYR